MKIKRIALCFLTISLFFMTGCSGILQLHERMVIQGIGVDLDASGYKVTIQALDFKNSAGANEPSVKLMELTGKSLIEALENAKKQSGLTPMYSQNLIVVVGKELAVSGMNNFLDFFIRHYEARPNVKICVSDTTASDILSIKRENGNIQAKEISDMIPDGLKSDILHFVGRLQGETSDPYCTYLSIQNRSKEKNGQNSGENKGGNKEQGENTGENSEENSKENKNGNSGENTEEILRVEGLALFSRDKMVGVATEKELLGTLATMGMENLGVYNIDSEKIGKVSLDLKKVKSKIKVNINENKFYIDIKLETNALEVTPNQGVRIGESEQKQIEKQLDSEIKTICEKAIQNSINLNSDIFRFGKVILNSDPEYFKNHKENLEELIKRFAYVVNVESSLSVTGTEI